MNNPEPKQAACLCAACVAERMQQLEREAIEQENAELAALDGDDRCECGCALLHGVFGGVLRMRCPECDAELLELLEDDEDEHEERA